MIISNLEKKIHSVQRRRKKEKEKANENARVCPVVAYINEIS